MRGLLTLGKLLRHARSVEKQNRRSLWTWGGHHACAASEDSSTISIDRSGLFNVDGRPGGVPVDKEPETSLAKQLKALIQARYRIADKMYSMSLRIQYGGPMD